MILYKNSVKTKLGVFSKIRLIYCYHIDIWYNLPSYYLGAYPNSPEEYHLIANA